MKLNEFIKEFRKKKLGITELMQVNDVLKEEIDKIRKEHDTKRDEKIRKKLKGFFKNLKENGVEVWLNKKDGNGEINDTYIDQAELGYLYKEYINKTIKEVIKEIERRQKEDDRKQ